MPVLGCYAEVTWQYECMRARAHTFMQLESLNAYSVKHDLHYVQYERVRYVYVYVKHTNLHITFSAPYLTAIMRVSVKTNTRD